MSQKIKFNRDSWFLGRNGTFTVSGLDANTLSTGVIVLQPITSRNKLGRCEIAIPHDQRRAVALAICPELATPRSTPAQP